MSFLKAEWRKLIMVNYEINPNVLQEYVPPGTTLDFFEGKCYVSLIGFMFLNTKLLGLKIPLHTNFEEVNLRFYVKRKVQNKVKRGVVFIKEIVPKPALTFVANTIYKEHYQTLPMKHLWNFETNKLKVSYQWKINNIWNAIAVASETKPKPIKENSIIEFIAEHYWGYSKINDKKTTEYEVKHPKWEYYPIKNYHIDVSFKDTYGDNFQLLDQQTPNSVMLLEGSEISVENKIVF
ncbi:YqjF family protein [Polaribacter sp.]|uniref:YqjF family protein n=1 Tax=Polaribacter sp. TaxID=1920175 RepID=UPI003EF8CC5C